MSRIVMMASATAALLITTSALAWGWQAGSRLTLVTSNGKTVVGVGTVDEGRLELTLSRAFSGFAVLVVEGSDGELSTLDVVVDADGSILIGEEGDFVDMGRSVSEAGLAFEIAVAGGEDRAAAAAGDGDAAAGVGDRPADDAETSSRPAGNGVGQATERASERAADGLERAGKVGNRAEGTADRAAGAGNEAAGGEASEANQGADVEVDVDVEGVNTGADVDLGGGAGDRVGNGRD